MTEDAADLTEHAIDDSRLRPAPGPGFLRASTLRTLWPFLARYPGLRVNDLLDEAGLRTPQRSDPQGWLSVRRCAAFIEAAATETNDSALALAFAEQTPWRDVGIPGYIALNSPTVGAALANGCRYFSLASTGASAQLEVEGHEAQLSYGIHDPAVATHPQNTQWIFAIFTRVCREGSGDPSWAPREVQFKHRRPANIAAQQAFFRCPLVFDQPYDAMVIAPEDLRLPFVHADSTLLPILVQSANAALTAQTGEHGFDHQVRRAVASSLRSGEVTIEHIALRLGISTRTIQRRLQDRGQSFKDVVAETRLALSRRYLENSTMSLTDAAHLLGYSELSAFSRAFRRWTGVSALEFRRRAAEGKAKD
ncbi:MAG: AraC family transcriptional regulator [Kofleriaceae bacterium]|nr:AraC family transcriptional regulator [Kofleriaceae bacterium]